MIYYFSSMYCNRKLFWYNANMLKSIIMMSVSVLIFTFWMIIFSSSSEKTIHYAVSYSGSIEENTHVFMTHTFTGRRYDGTDYDVYHILTFQDQLEKLFQWTVRTIQSGDKRYIDLKDYTILSTNWNHRLTVFEKEFLQKNKNKSIASVLQNTWLQYTIHTTAWLSHKTIVLQWAYRNQSYEKNSFQASITRDCGISQYRTDRQTCEVSGQISFILPIAEQRKQWNIVWVLYKTPLN
jgi:hypothetical protein